MKADVYWMTLSGLVACVSVVIGRRFLPWPLRVGARSATDKPSKQQPHDADCGSSSSRAFRVRFLRVYLLAMAAEWLQGPYLYSLLRDSKRLAAPTVAWLYLASYVSAALCSVGAGFLADRFGRRAACLACLAAHAAASGLTAASDCVAWLAAGRVLAGVAMALLWTVFESWMVTELLHARGLAGGEGGGGSGCCGLSLGGMVGLMTTSNCVAAVLCGLVGHCLVSATGSTVSPFILGIALEAVAAVLILRDWNENYGRKEAEPEKQPRPFASDVRFWTLSFVSCSFEGANYLVLFFWPAVLAQAHSLAQPDDDDASPLPLGAIFASFMAAMVLAALASGRFLGTDMPTPSRSRPALFLAGAVAVAAASLVVVAVAEGELLLLLAFVVFEACNGVYTPGMAFQRGVVVKDVARTGWYGVLRIPLYIFVAVALSTADSATAHRRTVLITCAGLLVAAAVASAVVLGSVPDDLSADNDEEDHLEKWEGSECDAGTESQG